MPNLTFCKKTGTFFKFLNTITSEEKTKTKKLSSTQLKIRLVQARRIFRKEADQIMAAFDLLSNANNDCDAVAGDAVANGALRDECVISLKVYDFCRLQECLTADVIGPARAAQDTTYCGRTVNAGDIIQPPQDTSSVTIEDLKAKKVIVVSKKPNPFRPGYWDVELKFVFSYRIIFRDVNGDELCCVRAQNSFTNKMTMFGSISTETLVSTDLFAGGGNSADMEADPFVCRYYTYKLNKKKRHRITILK